MTERLRDRRERRRSAPEGDVPSTEGLDELRNPPNYNSVIRASTKINEPSAPLISKSDIKSEPSAPLISEYDIKSKPSAPPPDYKYQTPDQLSAINILTNMKKSLIKTSGFVMTNSKFKCGDLFFDKNIFKNYPQYPQKESSKISRSVFNHLVTYIEQFITVELNSILFNCRKAFMIYKDGKRNYSYNPSHLYDDNIACSVRIEQINNFIECFIFAGGDILMLGSTIYPDEFNICERIHNILATPLVSYKLWDYDYNFDNIQKLLNFWCMKKSKTLDDGYNSIEIYRNIAHAPIINKMKKIITSKNFSSKDFNMFKYLISNRASYSYNDLYDMMLYDKEIDANDFINLITILSKEEYILLESSIIKKLLHGNKLNEVQFRQLLNIVYDIDNLIDDEDATLLLSLIDLFKQDNIDKQKIKKLIEVLLKRGVNTNMKYAGKEYPLYELLKDGYKKTDVIVFRELVELLIQFNADVNLSNDDGKTVYDLNINDPVILKLIKPKYQTKSGGGKVHQGKRGGQYIMVNGNKKYI